MAFTLAEVLITLGIIGVVAAMTLPTLIQKHQRLVLETQLKKTYTTLSQGIQKAMADEGVTSFKDTEIFNACKDETPDACTQALEKYFKIVNITDKSNKSREYISADPILENGKYILKKYPYKYPIIAYERDGYLYSLADGEQFVIGCFETNDYCDIRFDINGEKGPNISGLDVYAYINISETGKIEGRYDDSTLTIIMENGWKIPY